MDDVLDSASASRMEILGEGVPQPTEPLAPDAVAGLGGAIEMAVDALSQGQFQVPPMEGDGAEGVPPAMWATLGAVATFMIEAAKDMPEAKPYGEVLAKMPEMVTSNDGLYQLGDLFHQMGQDQALARALTQTPEAAPREEPEEKPQGSAAEMMLG